MTAQKYWLMKSEPESYGIDHLQKDKKTAWTGVRNFQARNFMREMSVGDGILFYHSNTKEPGVYGLAKVVSKAYPDSTQFDSKSNYFDVRAKKEKPIWELVDIVFVKKLKKPVLLDTLRSDTATHAMVMLQKGSRLSVTPATEKEYARVLELGN